MSSQAKLTQLGISNLGDAMDGKGARNKPHEKTQLRSASPYFQKEERVTKTNLVNVSLEGRNLRLSINQRHRNHTEA